MEDNYSKAYKEVVEILKYVPEENVRQIPKEIRELFEDEMSKIYEFRIDTTKPFEEQELLEETKAILANIFRDYWATDYQREKIIEKENQDRKKSEEEKREKYNPDDLFKNRKKNEFVEEQTIQLNNINYEYNNNLPMEAKKENVFKKLIGFIKNFLNIN